MPRAKPILRLDASWSAESRHQPWQMSLDPPPIHRRVNVIMNLAYYYMTMITSTRKMVEHEGHITNNKGR